MLDQGLRTAILSLRAKGHGTRQIARALHISRGAVRTVLKVGNPTVPRIDRAEDVEIGQQRLGGRGFRAHGGARRVVGDPQHEQGIGQHQIARRFWAGDLHLIEPPDLSGTEPMRRDRLDEADAVGLVGARQRDEVFHRGVGREAARPDLAVDRLGQIAD